MASKLKRVYKQMRKELATQNEDEDLNVRCTFCTRNERVTSFSSVQPGNHIYMGGEWGMRNIGNLQVAWYTHHAIVKKIELGNDSSAVLTLIHFSSTPYDTHLQIRETMEHKNLRNDEIYVVKYRHKTHPVETIISRAETLITDKAEYSKLSCNCEHFCHWCCIGNEESVQVHNVREALKGILDMVGNVGGKMLKVVLKLVALSVDELSSMASGALIGVPWGVLSVAAFAQLIYCIYKHVGLTKDLSQGNICSACCSRQKRDLWSRFGVYCLTQIGGLVLFSFVTTVVVSKGIIGGVMALVGVLTLISMCIVPKIINMFSSPFQGKQTRLETMRNIWIGDVLSFKHWKMFHDGIVSAVQIYPGTGNKKGEIKVIHYSLPQFFRRRKVVEEVIEVDLTKDLIKWHDYSGYNVHPPEVVVQRARQRIGETKFRVVSNRSCHFCHWAKVDEDIEDEPSIVEDHESVTKFVREINMQDSLSGYPEINVDHRRGMKHATKTLDPICARIRDDVKEGCIIQFKYKGFSHKAVSTFVAFSCGSPSKLAVTVVHYGKEYIVKKEQFLFDLNRDDIWVYKYHPLYRFNKTDVIRRANAKIGDRNYNWFTNRSSHLAEEIVEKNIDTLVNDMDDIHAGDVIIFTYWSLSHAAIVTRVRKDESKANNKGNMTVIHYGLDHLFAKRTVREEEIPIDLSSDHVYVKGFDGCITYPPEVCVKRANTRIGEERFYAFGNTSWDLVHWAKVVQSPVIVTRPVECNANQSSNSKERLLVPRIGEVFGEFQRMQVHAWSDLTPGAILEFKYYRIWHQGILTEKDEASKKIKIVHYGTAHILATRTIVEEALNVDLKHDGIRIYRCHPRRCNKPEDVIRKAGLRIGEQKWRKGNRSWDFCKACVLKEELQAIQIYA